VAVLHVSDDGDGVSALEREVLERESETDLEHASGLGLWFVHWTVQASGGDLSFEGGSTVSVTLPLADEDEGT